MEHARTQSGNLSGIGIGKDGQQISLGHDARIGAMQSGDIAVDSERLSAYCGGQDGGGIVRAVTTENRYQSVTRPTKVARQYRHFARAEPRVDPRGDVFAGSSHRWGEALPRACVGWTDGFLTRSRPRH